MSSGFPSSRPTAGGGIDIARIAKGIDPAVKIVFGGAAPTFLWEHFLTHFPEIDFVVIGEGEYTFLNLVQWIERDQDHPLTRIKGIAFRKNGRPVRTEPAEPIHDLDSLPVPSKYFEYQHLSLTRGCPGKCRFCGSPKFWGPKVRFHSPAYFVDELERLYKKGINFFYFSDDTFSVNKKRVIQICKKIIEKKLDISWVAISRVNTMSEEILSWMRRAGCIQISYGVESGSPKIRKFLNKKITNTEVEQAFAMTVKYGILPRAYFIYGCPGESLKTIGESLDLIEKIKPLVIHFFVLSLFPGTALYDEYKKKAGVTDDIGLNRIEDIKYFETDPKLSGDDVRTFGEQLRSRYHELIPEFVDAITLVEKKEFYPLHADFYSRLAMTFDQGDYAGNDAIPDKGPMAEKLYLAALKYYPHPRSYLGLGIHYQKQRAYPESVKILSQGITHFPDDEQINLCLSVSHMNLGAFKTALSYLLKFQHFPQALEMIVHCYHALNDSKTASAYHKKLESLK